MIVDSWTELLASSLQNLWSGVVSFVPSLVGAIVVFLIGLAIAAGLGTLVERIFAAVKLDQLLEKLGLAPYFDRAGMRLRGAWFLGRLVYWFLVIAFLLAASDILGLVMLSAFLRDVLLYIPNVVVAVLVMLTSVVAANFVRRLVQGSVLSAKLSGAHFLGSLTWWAIVLFGFFASLIQLRVAPSVLNAIVTGLIAMLALAGGLAFGLGGKEYASHLIG